MTTTAPTDHTAAPAGAPKLTPAQLRAAQAETLDTPRLPYSPLARALFTAMDLAYGRRRTIVKFTMLEFIARVPYQAWERIGYLALARHRRRSALAARIFGRIVQTRAEQYNEQWHLLILQDLVQRRGLRQSFLLHRLAPWLIAFGYGHDERIHQRDSLASLPTPRLHQAHQAG
jgi:ubiquinol oxidase